MNRSKRLQPIADIAAHREQEASKRMAAARANLDKHRAMLTDLERYHEEYAQSHNSFADAVRLQDFRLFMDRLEHAIAQQRRLIVTLEREFDTQQDDWRDRRSQRKALDMAADRFAREERRIAEQDEQRQIEEIAALLRTRAI
ncbi:MAG: flagellar export protein FliJ [Gammaproteobacteria bacterium]|nr:flagellar export protein FliJ [Gammaproteobacteria bacterium]